MRSIHKQGALAARQGHTIWACPFLLAHNMPNHSGQAIADWRAAIEAWEAGWSAETARRSPPPGPRRPKPTSLR